MSTTTDAHTISFSPAIHPGEILREEFLRPMMLSAGALAKALFVPRTRIERIVAEKTPITPDTALRLARYFGTTPQFWLNMQAAYDLATTEALKRDEIAKITASKIAS